MSAAQFDFGGSFTKIQDNLRQLSQSTEELLRTITPQNYLKFVELWETLVDELEIMGDAVDERVPDEVADAAFPEEEMPEEDEPRKTKRSRSGSRKPKAPKDANASPKKTGKKGKAPATPLGPPAPVPVSVSAPNTPLHYPIQSDE